MPLHPTLKRLITKAYLNGFGQIHQFDADGVRQYLSHPKVKVNQAAYLDYITDENITVRCYTPQGHETHQILPAIFYISASAFVIDRLDAGNDYCSLLANHSGMKVINIAHRLAPEHKFPQFLYDCLDSIRWCYKNHSQMRIDHDALSIWGESSGGSIAATCTHLLRDAGESIIKHQTLFYPMVDLVTPFESKTLYGQGYMLDRSFINWLDSLGFTAEQDRACALVSPLLSENFSGLPPATIISAEYDPLRDEAECYVEKLRAAGVPVAHQRFDGMIHGFMRFYDKIDVAQAALRFAIGELFPSPALRAPSPQRLKVPHECR